MLDHAIIGSYLPLLILLALAFSLGFLVILIPKLTATRHSYKDKNSQYECGFKSLSKRRELFDVRFYIISMLFIVFDLEIALLMPWALALRDLSDMGFYSMIGFITILMIGFVYEWKRGALES
jgi:NADH-quinone oxidoreductase subunit A